MTFGYIWADFDLNPKLRIVLYLLVQARAFWLVVKMKAWRLLCWSLLHRSTLTSRVISKQKPLCVRTHRNWTFRIQKFPYLICSHSLRSFVKTFLKKVTKLCKMALRGKRNSISQLTNSNWNPYDHQRGINGWLIQVPASGNRKAKLEEFRWCEIHWDPLDVWNMIHFTRRTRESKTICLIWVIQTSKSNL